MQNNNSADFATILSIFGAVVSVSSIQPYVTLVASLVAIVSGLFAIRYYYKVTKNLNK
jgi:undecaprenyl pyrophosphate phosphatase UppP